MSAGKDYCRQDFCRHTLYVAKTLYRQTVRRYLGVLPSDSLWAIMCHGVVYGERLRKGVSKPSGVSHVVDLGPADNRLNLRTGGF
jgi:hypothetical protein